MLLYNISDSVCVCVCVCVCCTGNNLQQLSFMAIQIEPNLYTHSCMHTHKCMYTGRVILMYLLVSPPIHQPTYSHSGWHDSRAMPVSLNSPYGSQVEVSRLFYIKRKWSKSKWDRRFSTFSPSLLANSNPCPKKKKKKKKPKQKQHRNISCRWGNWSVTLNLTMFLFLRPSSRSTILKVPYYTVRGRYALPQIHLWSWISAV